MNKEGIIDAAKSRMIEAIEADRDNREAEMDDLEKLVGNHWPEDIKNAREAAGKPCLTINRFPQFVRQVTGDIRRMNPAIKVFAADSAAQPETAEIYDGIIRHIEYRSDASSVYEQTAESAAAGSIGWFRVLNEWGGDDSFDQEILIKRIRNSFSVYCDPRAEMPTREDAGYMFITDNLSAEDFKESYPKAAMVDAEHDGVNDKLENWYNEGKIVVAEYYWKEPVDRKIGLLADGTIVQDPKPPMMFVKERTVKSHKVMWAKITGKEVLEGPTEQPCKHIPIVAITGEEWHVGERVHRSSVIRYAKDAQQMYNYWRSASTEVIALQPKAPYIGTANQFKGFETFWNEANTSNRPYLPYNPDPKAPGAPQRSTPPVSSSGMMNEIMSAAEDMKATTGIYDAALGGQSNETSGVAIRQRQIESDVSTSIYTDNMAKAIAHCGRILVDMIPKIYDTNRIVRIIGPDDNEKMVPVNGIVQTQDGPQAVNDLTAGKYDVRVSVGPNYSTRRQETAEGMMEFIRVLPQAGQVTMDLVAKSMDWPDADKFADRLKKMLPPGMIDMQDMDPEDQQAAQQAQQAAQQQQQQQQQIQQAAFMSDMQEKQGKAAKLQAEAEGTQLDNAQKQFELAIQSGLFNEAIQTEVARALQGVFGPPQGQF